MRRIVLPRDMTQMSAAELAGRMPAGQIGAVVHAAAARFPKSSAERFLNSRGPALVRQALDRRARLIHVSSLNVLIRRATDAYSRSKTEGERGLAGQTGVVVVRPSMIWDAAGRTGNAARLCRAVARAPLVVPVPQPGPSFRPIDVADLANAIIDLATNRDPPALVNVMGECTLTLRELTEAIALNYGKSTWALPIEALTPRVLRKFLPRAIRAGDPDMLEPPPGLERGLDRYLPRPILARSANIKRTG